MKTDTIKLTVKIFIGIFLAPYFDVWDFICEAVKDAREWRDQFDAE